MKEDIRRAVLEMVDKSGVEITSEEREQIVEEAIGKAIDRIIRVANSESLAEGSTYMRIWVRFGESPELPGVKQKRAALVAFIRNMTDETIDVHVGAWYDGRVIYTNQGICDIKEPFEGIISATLRSIKARAADDEKTTVAAYLNIMETAQFGEREAKLTAPPLLLDMAISGETKKAVERIRELEYGKICDMCRSDLDLVRIVVDAGQACDGVLASFAGQIVRLSNELPMIKQEAKSYAIHHAQDLLEPYRFDTAKDKMTGWATW